MNFVAQLEEYLRDLGAEARKKHPGVKEASERAILKLRTLQNNYVSAVRQASANGETHPDTTLFRSSDLLHPFLLAANYPNASPKLLDTSFKAMKTLMEADAICPGDGMNLVRVWMIQAHVVVSYSTKGDISGGSSSSRTTSAGSINGGLGSSSESIDCSTDGTSGGAESQSTGSWLGSFLSSSTSTAKETGKSMTHAVSTKSAVSSSHGQAGSGHLNAKDLEKLALDILSCLLQLLELRDLPVATEQWIQSITLCCLLYLPSRQTVRQATHSTLPQVLTLLVKDDKAKDLAVATWEDLLTCSMGVPQTKNVLHGAFSHCRVGGKDVAQPPSPSLSLDLMITLLQEAPFVFSQVGLKTLHVVIEVLKKQSSSVNTSPREYLRVLQFVIVMLQTQAKEWPTECRELVMLLVHPLPMATEAIRKQADFEDGYIFTVPNKTLLPSTVTLDTLKNLPPAILWKAALSVDTLKVVVNDRSLRFIWSHPEVIVQLLEATSDFCSIGASCEEHMILVVLACRQKDHSLAYAAESLNSIDLWRKGQTKDDFYVLGEALWIGLTTVLKMIDSLDDSALESAFAPSLAVLQHYLKRFPASGTIVQRSLEGYFSLAKVSLQRPLIRRALLTSLCKLSLPQWGTHDATYMLQDHNIAALICLMNVVHRFYDSIGSEWSIVIQTFQELSVMTIASPHLSDSAYVGALSISAVYSRFASFSTCLSDQSLSDFVEGLKEVSLLEQTPNVITSPVGGVELLRVPSKIGDSSMNDEKETIGKTLMNLGVRAIYGGAENGAAQQHKDVPLAERTKNRYSHDYQSEFARRVAESKHPIRVNQVPFTFSLLVDVAMTNSFRNNTCGATMHRGLCSLASDVPAVKHFSMDAVAMLVMSQLAGDGEFPTNFIGPGKIMYEDPRQNQYLAVEAVKRSYSGEEDVSQAALLGPICQCIREVKYVEVAEAGVESLHAILETCGHDLDSDAWTTVIQAVSSLPSPDRSSKEWANSCLVGFRCLKLIVDDFADLTDASTEARTSLLDCCSSFGSSLHDVNTSLTAIGLLWAIVDQDTGTVSIDRALSKLVILSSDNRAEVRNCAVNTLFSCIVGRGQAFTDEQWKACVCGMVFVIFDSVTSRIESDGAVDAKTAGTDIKKSRYRVNVHHSRDSAVKQWVTTQALVLQGLCRVMRIFFSKLLETTENGSESVNKQDCVTPWFDDAWNKILGYAFEASTQVGGRDTLDLRNSGSELLVLCAQLACKEGIHAAITPARVGTNMEVVNGALRSVRSPEKTNDASKDVPRHANSVVTEMWRENLFLDAFDVLDSFCEHLESDASNHHEPGLHHTLEPTQVQVLSRFSGDMGKLYECCKGEEFAEDRTFDDVGSFDKQLAVPRPVVSEGDPMVLRFVHIISAVAIASSSGPDSRFLSQAQRSCLDILRTMASDGSPEAFLSLTELAGSTFFLQRDEKGKPKKGVDIMCHEASTILQEEFTKDSLSHECRVLVICRMLTVFLGESDVVNAVEIGSSYDLLVPVLTLGLISAQELQKTLATSTNLKAKLLNILWEKVSIALVRLLLPTAQKDSTKVLTIEHPMVLVDIVTATAQTAPCRHREELCAIFASGATECLEAAKTNPGVKVTKDSLQLFTACFTGVCVMDPKNRILKGIAEQIFSSSLKILSKKEGEDESTDPSADIDVQACLLICHAIRDVPGVGLVAIEVFPQLCHLCGVEDMEIRQSVGGVLAKVDMGSIIAESEALRLASEERAIVAEIEVVELTNQVETLRQEKAFLESQRTLM